MTLQEFLNDTANMPPSTPLLIVDAFGNLAPSSFFTLEDLEPGDPLRHTMPPEAICLAEAAV